MPQVVLFLAVGAGLYMGYKALKSALAPVARTAEARRAEHSGGMPPGEIGPRNLGALVWDERDQVYRPKG